MNILHEQNNGLIRLDGSCRRLPILEAWRNSSAVYWIAPDFPASAMSFKVGKEDATGYYDSIAMTLHVKRGLWRAYVPRTMFTGRCETGYKITAVDEYGNRHICGEGLLRVYTGRVFDADDGYDPTLDCYVLFPDGNWRRVSVIQDASGELTFTVAQDPSEPIAGHTFTTPYAYRKDNGLFYAVTGFVDETGEAYLSVAQEGVSGQDKAFALDDTTGFWYRVETEQDALGEMTINVGDKR